MIVSELSSLVKASLVESVKIGQMDLQPPQTLFSKGLGLREFEQSATEIVAHVVQMRRNGVSAPSEVEVVGEVNGISKELTM